MPEGRVYILGSTTGTLYTGVTSDFDRRFFEHKNGIKSGFASKYHCNRLLLIESFTTFVPPSHAKRSSKAGLVRRSWLSSPS